MTLVDRDGRLFGRVNLVDAILLCLALGLVPLGYAAYRLFRLPPPRLTSVEPITIMYGSQMKVKVHGQNFRPYMRISFSGKQGRDFGFIDATTAEVNLDETVSPGVYDVVLFDSEQERSRLPKALTVTGALVPTTQMVVIGMLSNLDADRARQVVPGMDLATLGQILSVGRAGPSIVRLDMGGGETELPAPSGVQVPVSVLVRCDVPTVQDEPRCMAGGQEVRLKRTLTLRTPLGPLPLHVDQIRSVRPLVPVRVRVRFSGDPGALAHITVGESDLGRVANELVPRGHVVAAASVRRASDQDATRDVDLVVPAQMGAATWVYGGDRLRIGGPFMLQTPLYELSGRVIDLSPPPVSGTP